MTVSRSTSKVKTHHVQVFALLRDSVMTVLIIKVPEPPTLCECTQVWVCTAVFIPC